MYSHMSYLHMYSMLELDHGLKKPGLGMGGGVVC